MPEHRNAISTQLVLWRHRLVRVCETTTLAGQARLSAASAPASAGPAFSSTLLEWQARLAAEARQRLREAQPALGALLSALEAESAPAEAKESQGLVCSILHLLPGELAAGANARIADIDWVFATLLNAPGHAGLIEQGLQALSTPATFAAPVQLSLLSMTATPEPKPDPEHEGRYLPNGKASKAGLNQSIFDAGWCQFQSFCIVKAERAGRRVVLVDPSHTSQVVPRVWSTRAQVLRGTLACVRVRHRVRS